MEEEPRVTLEKAEDALSIALKKVRVARVALEEAEDARVTLKEARDAINIALKKVEEVIGDLEEEKQVRVVFLVFPFWSCTLPCIWRKIFRPRLCTLGISEV